MPLVRHVAASVHGRTLVRPAASGPARGWLVGFHGYAQLAEPMLETLERVPRAERWLLASVQALHPFYAGRNNEVVANWMTRQDRELAIADNVAYVDGVLETLAGEFGAPPVLVFAGFSQGVAMAYRAALLGRRRCAAVIAAGGDVPPELMAGADRAWPTVLVATGERDPFYTPERLGRDLEFFRAHGIDARPLVFDGGHEWSDAVHAAAGELLAALEAAPAPP
jgi:predicted esterase